MKQRTSELLSVVLLLLLLPLVIQQGGHYFKASLFAASQAKGLSFVSVKGNQILDGDGRKVRFRGIQMDFGSMRGDVPEGIVNNKKLEIIFDEMINHIVTEDDFINIKKMGMNLVRLSLNTYKDFEYDSIPFSYREENFKKLDRVVGWAKKHDIYLVISMRQSPGGHNSSPHSGNQGLNKLWSGKSYQKRLSALWKIIASRYKNESVIAGYDLLNEPNAPNKKIFNQVYRGIIKEIRKTDDKHIVFLEGNLWAKNIGWIKPDLDNNAVLSVHFYEPGIYIEGKTAYPSVIQGKTFNQLALKKNLKSRILPGQIAGMPIWVGEFGAMTKADNYLSYNRDVINLFEELNLHWSYWNYKNLRGISDSQAIYYSKKNNRFVQLTNQLQKSKRAFPTLTRQDWRKALESLRTKNYSEKQELKDLLIDCIANSEK